MASEQLRGHPATASVTGADTQTQTDSYDTAMRLQSVQDSLLGTPGYGYDANGNPTQITWPGGSYYATFQYDPPFVRSGIEIAPIRMPSSSNCTDSTGASNSNWRLFISPCILASPGPPDRGTGRRRYGATFRGQTSLAAAHFVGATTL